MKDINVTAAQRQIITHPVDASRTLRIVSGPGAGKSTTLVYKLAYLVGEGLIPPERILVLSMTNRAVDSMKSKLVEVLGEQVAATINVHTFHALSHMMMSEKDDWYTDVEVLDEPGWTVLSQLAKINKYRLRDCITKVKALGGDEDAIRRVSDEFGISHKSLKNVLELLDRMHTIIHSDFLRGAKKLMKNGEVSLEYDICVVDEFQDMYQELWEFIELIARDTHLVVAGDPHQSIYNFLGSNDIVEEKLEDYRPSDTISMTESFRSTPQIISASEQVLSHDRSLTSTLQPVCKPILTTFSSEDEQYQYISDEILRLTLSSSSQIQYRDIAILARTNVELQNLTRTLSFYHIPNLKLSSNPTWLDNELVNLMNYLNVLYRPERAHWSVVCTLRLVPGVGPVMVTRLEHEANEKGVSFYDYLVSNRENLKPVVQNYIDTMEQTRQSIDFHDTKSIMKGLLHVADKLGLKRLVSRKVKTQMDHKHVTKQILDFYENMKMFALEKPEEISVAEYFLQNYMDRVGVIKRKDAVRVSTVHSAKGLEFPIVFLLAGDKIVSESEEDRRLLYVGMTRAQSLLYVNVLDNGTQGFNEPWFQKKFRDNFQFEAPNVTETLIQAIKQRPQPMGQVRQFHTSARRTFSKPFAVRSGLKLVRHLVRN